MTNPRIQWRANPSRRALKTLADIERTIAALANEDLLNLADIVGADAEGALSTIALAEMNRRDIALKYGFGSRTV